MGQASVQQLMIVNRGSVATRVSSLALTGPGAPDFAVAPGTTCQPGSLLAPGTGCTIALRFAPGTAGPRAARVQVRAGGSDTPAASAELSGMAHAQSAPRLLLDAVALSFAEQPVGSAATGEPQQVTVHNAGRETLLWSSRAGGGRPRGRLRDRRQLLDRRHTGARRVVHACDFTSRRRPRGCAVRACGWRPRTALRWRSCHWPARGVTVATAQLGVVTPALDVASAPRSGGSDPGPGLDWRVQATTPTHTGTAAGSSDGGPGVDRRQSRQRRPRTPLRWRIAGAAAADYSIDPASTCVWGAVLPAGGTCVVGVKFHPGAGGLRVAELQLTTGDATLTQGLDGRGSAPAAGLLAAAPMAAVFQAAPGRSPLRRA